MGWVGGRVGVGRTGHDAGGLFGSLRAREKEEVRSRRDHITVSSSFEQRARSTRAARAWLSWAPIESASETGRPACAGLRPWVEVGWVSSVAG